MDARADTAFRNQLLSGLDKDDLSRLLPQLSLVQIERGQIIEGSSQAIEHVYFLESGLASVIAVNEHDERVEAGPFGRDGMSGLAVVLGADRSPNQTVVQVPGDAHKIAAASLREVIEDSPAVRGRFLRYVQAFSVQTAHTALANARFTVEERLARWLLMLHDRLGNDIEVTHEFISTMLGVRRAGVTTSLHVLEGHGFVGAVRGKLTILNRDGLVEMARGSYGLPEAEYARLLGPSATLARPG